MAESTKADEKNEKKVLRRHFLTGSGAAIAAGALAAGLPATKALAAAPADLPTPTEGKVTYPASTGYIVYDSRVCFGCQSCMFACSMAHQGEINPTLSRIQIVKDAPSFTTYPLDIAARSPQTTARTVSTPESVRAGSSRRWSDAESLDR